MFRQFQSLVLLRLQRPSLTPPLQQGNLIAASFLLRAQVALLPLRQRFRRFRLHSPSASPLPPHSVKPSNRTNQSRGLPLLHFHLPRFLSEFRSLHHHQRRLTACASPTQSFGQTHATASLFFASMLGVDRLRASSGRHSTSTLRPDNASQPCIARNPNTQHKPSTTVQLPPITILPGTSPILRFRSLSQSHLITPLPSEPQPKPSAAPRLQTKYISNLKISFFNSDRGVAPILLTENNTFSFF